MAIANDAAEFARSIVQLLQNDAERKRMATAAREFASQTFSPRTTEQQARTILENLGVLTARNPGPEHISSIEPAGELA